MKKKDKVKAMSFGKYLLYRVGHFKKWEPDVSDVLNAAISVHSIKKVVNSRGRHYFYIFPVYSDFAHVSGLLRTFRSNGVILRPHKSHNYGELVWRVPDRKQKFISDVMDVINDKDAFQMMLAKKYQKEIQH